MLLNDEWGSDKLFHLMWSASAFKTGSKIWIVSWNERQNLRMVHKTRGNNCCRIAVLVTQPVGIFISDSIRCELHEYVFKSFHFHIVVISNRSTSDCVLKCLHFHDRLHHVPCEHGVKTQRYHYVFIGVTEALETVSLKTLLIRTKKNPRRILGY